MCGIVGALSFKKSNFEITPEYIVRMRDTMIHRGPDGGGVWVNPGRKLGFGHRRLSIIDLSEAASEPMSNEDDSVWLTYNGEIYNHAEIRAELEELGGHTWKTNHSDAEVIIHAFEEWGIDCIHRFRGMFAFGLWDERKKQLWLVRDRLGIKPLYYSVHHGRLVFASEIKAMLMDEEQPREVDEPGFFHYLSFLTTPAPDTLFKGIHKLPNGCLLRIDESGDVEERRYWDVWDHTSPLTGVSDDEIAERLLEELRTAVKYRKVSDVPVGVFLSGGIDSSTNAKLFAEGETGKVKTFTIGYHGDNKSYKNENHYAKMVADLVGAEYHELLLDQDDLVGFLPHMIHLQDEPIGDPVCVPSYFVSKLARENGVIVCQVGEGADELFSGYPTWNVYLKAAKMDRLPIPRFLKGMGASGLKAAGMGARNLHEAFRRGARGEPIFWSGADVFTHSEKHDLLAPSLLKRLGGITSWESIAPLRKRFEEKAWEKTDLNWMTYADLNLRLPELLLMRVDKMAMGVSLEARTPFLDHKFVELAMSIPTEVKLRGGEPKAILKRAVRGVIPDEIIDRPKQGFAVPVYDWIFDKLGDEARRELNWFCDHTDFFDKATVNRYIDNGKGSQVWYMLNFAMWWKTYICA